MLNHIFFTSTILKIFMIIHHSFCVIIINGIGEGGGVEVGVALILNILIVYFLQMLLNPF